jgi:glycosyltransferase involved in cell wall biosynthesis
MHARGMLEALRRRIGTDNVAVLEVDRSENNYRHSMERFKKRFSKYLTFIRITRRYLLSFKNAKKLHTLMTDRGVQPDFILARSVLYDHTPLFLAKKFGCRLIIEHNTPLVYECCDLNKSDFRMNVRNFERNILSRANGIYVVSEYLRKMLDSAYGCGNKTITIANGYMDELFVSGIDTRRKIRDRIRQEHNPRNKWIVVFIGSLQIWHGIENLINAAEILSVKDGIEFWVLGDGERRNEVKKYAESHDNLKWFGSVPVEKMRDFLYGCDLGVMPYNRIEHFYFSPLKMYDLIGANLPFLGLKVGQIEELCSRELNEDFMLPDASGSSLAKRISLLQADTERYATMRQLVNKVRENHTWDVRADKLVAWINTLQ